MQVTRSRPRLSVTTDGTGVVAHAGTRLLADLADATGLTTQFTTALATLRQRERGHRPGRIAVDLTLTLTDGGQSISDLAILRQQPHLFAAVASAPTAWRMLAGIDDEALAALTAARAQTRALAWAQATETGRAIPATHAAGREIPGLVIDLDATVVICHSEKQQAAPTFKHTFGYHPLLAFCDNTGEALAGMLRAGNAGSNTAADHIGVLDAALAQIPEQDRYGTPILIRTDTAGCTQEFLAHIRSLRAHGLDIRFSAGMAITEGVRRVLAHLVDEPHLWIPALDQDGEVREHAQICEITDLIDTSAYPPGTRVIVRRELPHPGAQLSLFDHIVGWRHQLCITDTPYGHGPTQYLEARHRAHARVEDRIRTAKDCGLGRFPSRSFAINAAWLTLALTAIDLLAWTRWLLLEADLAHAEPKQLRYRLLHTAARITRSARRTYLRLAATWPWRKPLADAFARVSALPQPAT